MISVRVMSDWSLEARARAVEAIFRNPHKYTHDDAEWMMKHFGVTRRQLKASFILFHKQAGVFDGDQPIYLFGVDEHKRINTLSHASLAGREVSMTKAVLRFQRTAEGVRFFADTIGVAELSDSTPELEAWAKKLGFAKYTQAEYNGQKFNFFHRGAR